VFSHLTPWKRKRGKVGEDSRPSRASAWKRKETGGGWPFNALTEEGKKKKESRGGGKGGGLFTASVAWGGGKKKEGGGKEGRGFRRLRRSGGGKRKENIGGGKGAATVESLAKRKKKKGGKRKKVRGKKEGAFFSVLWVAKGESWGGGEGVWAFIKSFSGTRKKGRGGGEGKKGGEGSLWMQKNSKWEEQKGKKKKKKVKCSAFYNYGGEGKTERKIDAS